MQVEALTATLKTKTLDYRGKGGKGGGRTLPDDDPVEAQLSFCKGRGGLKMTARKTVQRVLTYS